MALHRVKSPKVSAGTVKMVMEAAMVMVMAVMVTMVVTVMLVMVVLVVMLVLVVLVVVLVVVLLLLPLLPPLPGSLPSSHLFFWGERPGLLAPSGGEAPD